MSLNVDNKPAAGPVPLGWESQRARVWSWLPVEEIEPATLQQIKNIGELPNAVAVAVMPDAHKGYGMPIGTALATEGAVVPYAVGVDIGCGMVAVDLNLSASGIELVCPPDSDVLDEAGGAYKDLEDVMRWQADLVEPVVKLRPLGCVKG